MRTRHLATAASQGSQAAASDLALCEGFRVECPDGYVGAVDALRYEPSARWDFPSALVVHAGRASEMLLVIPLAEVDSVSFAERRVILRASPRITATERMAAGAWA